jgi:hypothetical protein
MVAHLRIVLYLLRSTAAASASFQVAKLQPPGRNLAEIRAFANHGLFVYDSFWRWVQSKDLGAGAEEPSADLPKTSGSMNRRDLVLAILAAADGRTFTPVQIQKAVFVVCDQYPELIDDGPKFHFEPYDYGPFDPDVYNELAGLARTGDAIIAPSGQGNWNTYAASDAGITRGENLWDQLDKDASGYIQKISDWVRSLSFKRLVKSIYEAYPHMRANSIFRG